MVIKLNKYLFKIENLFFFLLVFLDKYFFLCPKCNHYGRSLFYRPFQSKVKF